MSLELSPYEYFNNTDSSTDKYFAFCIDETYACHLATLLVTLNRCLSAKVSCIILSSGLSSRVIQKLKLLQSDKISIGFFDVDEALFNKFPISIRYNNRLSSATFYRLLLPEILGKEINRVIYVDADIIFLNDPLPMFGIDIQQAWIGAVSDASLVAQKRWTTLGNTTLNYFNAGMMLMDLQKWRENHVAEKAMRLLEAKADWEYNDQDVLNIALDGQVKYLSPKWNAQSYSLLRQSVESPTLVHFTGAEKPWHLGCIHPYTIDYLHAREQSGFPLRERTVFQDQHDIMLLEKIRELIPDNSNILIFGAGQKGRRLFHAMNRDQLNLKVVGFLDSFKSGSYEGVPIYSTLPKVTFDCIVISSLAFQDEIIQTLNDWGIDRARVI